MKGKEKAQTLECSIKTSTVSTASDFFIAKKVTKNAPKPRGFGLPAMHPVIVFAFLAFCLATRSWLPKSPSWATAVFHPRKEASPAFFHKGWWCMMNYVVFGKCNMSPYRSSDREGRIGMIGIV
jgi:hypothetical protein